MPQYMNYLRSSSRPVGKTHVAKKKTRKKNNNLLKEMYINKMTATQM